MALRRIRYLVGKKGAGNTTRWWWQPSGALRAQGFKPVRLARDDRTPWGKPAPGPVCDEADRWNARLDAWTAGKGAHPFEDDKPTEEGEAASPRKAMKPGTVDALIQRYKHSEVFHDRAESTRHMYSENLEIISRWAGDVPARHLDVRMALAFYDAMRGNTPTKANHVMSVLRLLYSFALTRGGTETVPENPFMKLDLVWTRKDPIIWEPQDVALFVKHADRIGRPSVGTAVMLNEWVGQRKGDVLAIPRNAWRDGGLRFIQSKTKKRVYLPIDLVPKLTQRLQEEAARWAARQVTPTTLIASEATNEPYTKSGFEHVFRRIREAAAEEQAEMARKQAEIAGKQTGMAEERPRMADLWFMRLRHTAVVRLAESGATVPWIAAVTGHTLSTCHAILEIYNVHTDKMAESAFRQRLKGEASDVTDLSSEREPLR